MATQTEITSTILQPTDSKSTAAKSDRQIIVILDFGSQYSELIARRIRETQVYSEVISYRTTAAQLQEINPKGIILSGGPSSVYDDQAPKCDPEIWNLGNSRTRCLLWNATNGTATRRRSSQS